MTNDRKQRLLEKLAESTATRRAKTVAATALAAILGFKAGGNLGAAAHAFSRSPKQLNALPLLVPPVTPGYIMSALAGQALGGVGGGILGYRLSRGKK